MQQHTHDEEGRSRGSRRLAVASIASIIGRGGTRTFSYKIILTQYHDRPHARRPLHHLRLSVHLLSCCVYCGVWKAERGSEESKKGGSIEEAGTKRRRWETKRNGSRKRFLVRIFSRCAKRQRMRGCEAKVQKCSRAGNWIYACLSRTIVLSQTHSAVLSAVGAAGATAACAVFPPFSPTTIIILTALSTAYIMPQASDSSYAAVTRHRRPFSTAGRPPVFRRDPPHRQLLSGDDDDVMLQHHEESVTTEEEDPDAGCVAPAGNSSAAAQSLRERRRREEGWNDHGLEALLASATAGAAGSRRVDEWWWQRGTTATTHRAQQ